MSRTYEARVEDIQGQGQGSLGMRFKIFRTEVEDIQNQG
jgi:hypothetical protein